jgi:predicted MFS family arabinose efflux permease
VRLRGKPTALLVFVTAAVAIAFADSSIVVLALPELYGRFNATIEGVSWVITAYNVAVAASALALVLFAHRLSATVLLSVGLFVFLASSIACAAAGSLSFLIGARVVEGIGAALLLAGSLPLLASLRGSAARGARLWTLAGTFGAALGPALGGVLTQLFDWRAIFVAQAPVAAIALVLVLVGHPHAVFAQERHVPPRRTLLANTCLALLFGSLVGVLFLAVLLVITGWGYSPIEGALIVSSLPAATFAVRPLERRLPTRAAVAGGAALLAGGLVVLALLPSASVALTICALLVCGAGLGLSVPLLSDAALDLRAGLTSSGTFTIGIRHLGLVAALATIAPVLANSVPAAGDRALLKATAVLLDSPVGLDKKIPVALDLRAAFDKAQSGETPDLAEPFDAHGAAHDSQLAATRDDLVGTIHATIARAFRPAFFLSAAFAGLALLVVGLWRDL